MRITSIIIILGLFTIVSCDNEINVLKDSGPIPIVYGLIDLADTATYIRVEKSFGDPTVPPSDLAENPDQIYYDNIAVQLSDQNSDSGKRFTLERVDGSEEGYPREEGPFAEAPNYLYKIKNSELPFNNSSIAQIEVIDTDSDSVLAYSATNIVNRLNLSYPSPSSQTFIDVIAGDDVRYTLNSNINESEISYFIGSLKYLVKEYNEENGNLINRIEQTVYVNEVESQFDVEFEGVALFNKLANTLEPKQNVVRRIDSIYAQVNAYGLELNEYQDIQRLNSGITSSSFIPVYNNIENGRGLFTSAASDSKGPFLLSRLSYDSLNQHPLTKDLNFTQ